MSTCTHKKCPGEVLLLITHNIWLYREIRRKLSYNNIPKYFSIYNSLKEPLNCKGSADQADLGLCCMHKGKNTPFPTVYLTSTDLLMNVTSL